MNSFKAASLFSKGNLWAALAGAGGGLLSFFVGEAVRIYQETPGETTGFIELVINSALWSGAIGLTIGAAILVYDNLTSLRGQWHRNLLAALPLFFGLSFLGGAAGQTTYSLIQNSLTRGIGWSLIGASTGIGIGLLRRDMIQAGRGALGGAIGGFLGGFIFNGLTLISSAGNGSFSRFVGQILMGALIALLMRVVQEALKDAWLLGISTGPYEGKEYPLNTARVTVGREDSNAIALFREREMPAQLGALVFQNQTWNWQGAPVPINGVVQSAAVLNPGDTLQLGSTHFRFYHRSVKSPAPAPYFVPDIAPPAAYSAPVPQCNPVVDAAATQPWVAPAPVAALPSYALLGSNGQLVPLPDLSAPATIGRAAGNEVVLPDPAVSSRHAQLQLKGGALYMTDLGSTNGTFINGAKISPQTSQLLRAGDRIRLGSLEYTLRAG